jgi:hypothetical protein
MAVLSLTTNLTIRDIEQALLTRLEPLAKQLGLRLVNKPSASGGRMKPKGEVELFYASSSYGSATQASFNQPKQQDRTFIFQISFVFPDSRDATVAYEAIAEVQAGLGGYRPFDDARQDDVLHFMSDRYEKRDDTTGSWVYVLMVGYTAVHVLKEQRV